MVFTRLVFYNILLMVTLITDSETDICKCYVPDQPQCECQTHTWSLSNRLICWIVTFYTTESCWLVALPYSLENSKVLEITIMSGTFAIMRMVDNNNFHKLVIFVDDKLRTIFTSENHMLFCLWMVVLLNFILSMIWTNWNIIKKFVQKKLVKPAEEQSQTSANRTVFQHSPQAQSFPVMREMSSDVGGNLSGLLLSHAMGVPLQNEEPQ